MTDPGEHTIWKYVLPQTDRVELFVPNPAEVLHVGAQGHELCIWIRVRPTYSDVRRVFNIVGTGNPLPNPLGDYIGTAQVGVFVWHVFDVTMGES